MTLNDWLTSEDLTQAFAAKRLGVSQPSISYLVKGNRLPSLRLMQKILTMTNGAVTIEDFLSTGRLGKIFD